MSQVKVVHLIVACWHITHCGYPNQQSIEFLSSLKATLHQCACLFQVCSCRSLLALHVLEMLCVKQKGFPVGLGTAIQRCSNDSVQSQRG